MMNGICLEVGPIVRLDGIVDCLGGVLVGPGLSGEHLAEGDSVALAPLIRFPEIRSDERLRAMEEALIDANARREDRGPSAGGHSLEEGRVTRELGPAVDAKGFGRTGDHEDQADVRVFDDVQMAEYEFVSRSIGNRESLIVFDESEAGRVSLGRSVEVSVGIRSSHDDERATCEKINTECIESIEHLHVEIGMCFTHELA